MWVNASTALTLTLFPIFTYIVLPQAQLIIVVGFYIQHCFADRFCVTEIGKMDLLSFSSLKEFVSRCNNYL